MISRRHFLAAGLAGAATLSLPSLALATGSNDRRFVFVILRGGLDGLAAVPAIGDPAFAGIRGALASDLQPLPLSGPFAIDARLPGLHRRFGDGELAVVHAVATPYRERSHFDAQQVLESGGPQAHAIDSGWLGRALTAGGARGLALSSATPLVLRGAPMVDSWSPSRHAEPDPEFVARIERMYATDPQLAQALDRARAVQREAGALGMQARAPGRVGFVTLAQAAGEFLAAERGARVAVLDFPGWDTHANQALAQGALARNFTQLDDGLDALRIALGPVWRKTAVLVASEFGRAVAANGTRGTDHGTAGVAFVLGGAVAGGRVIGDWPGLGERELHEQRDLRPTTDFRALAMGLIGPLLGLSSPQLRTVFPGSDTLRPLGGLLRADG